MEKLVKSLINPHRIFTCATSHGIRRKSKARAMYEAKMGVDVEESGLLISKTHPNLAASPDGLVGNDTVLEIKCPFTAKD